MALTTAALATEINTDPSALGLSAPASAGNDAGVAAILNQVRAGAAYKVDAGVLPAYQVVNALVPSELKTRAASQLSQVQIMTGAGQIDTANANIQAMFLDIFDVATAPNTRAALIALAKRQGSRAEVLGGPGTVVTANDVSRALRGVG